MYTNIATTDAFMPICKDCNENKPDELFPWWFDKKRNKSRFKPQCSDCERERQRIWRSANKDKKMQYLTNQELRDLRLVVMRHYVFF